MRKWVFNYPNSTEMTGRNLSIGEILKDSLSFHDVREQMPRGKHLVFKVKGEVVKNLDEVIELAKGDKLEISRRPIWDRETPAFEREAILNYIPPSVDRRL